MNVYENIIRILKILIENYMNNIYYYISIKLLFVGCDKIEYRVYIYNEINDVIIYSIKS